MATKNKVEIELDGKNKGAIKAINGTSNELTKFDKKVDSFSSSFSNKFRSITDTFQKFGSIFGLGIGAGITGLGLFIKKNIETIDVLNKTSQKLGVTTEFLSTTHYAAELAGIKQETYNMALQRFTRRSAEAVQGLGEARGALIQLGVQLNDNEGRLRSSEELLYDVSDGLSKVESSGERVRLAFKLFDSEGVAMVNMLQNGSEEMKRMQDEARKLGLEIDTNTAQSASNLVDQMTKLEGAIKGLTLKYMPWIFDELLKLSYVIENFSWGSFWDVLTFDETSLLEGYDIWLKKLNEATKIRNEQLDIALQNQRAIEDEQRRVERLNLEWNKQSALLTNDIIRAGLDPQLQKLFDLEQRAESLRIKYASIPGAVSLINEWLQDQLKLALNIEAAVKAVRENFQPIPFGEGPEPTTPETLYNPYTAILEQQKSQIAELTEFELYNFALRQQATVDMFTNMAGAAENFYSIMGEQQGAAFELYKAFSIAQAGIDTYQSAIAAYKAMVGIPIVGPGLAVTAAAAATAFGLSNIARIASMQPGSSVSGINTASTTSVSNVTNNNSSSNVTRNYTINVYSNYQDPDELARNLVPYIKKAESDGF